jgi:hypothetical protein
MSRNSATASDYSGVRLSDLSILCQGYCKASISGTIFSNHMIHNPPNAWRAFLIFLGIILKITGHCYPIYEIYSSSHFK